MNRPQSGSPSKRRTGLLSERRFHSRDRTKEGDGTVKRSILAVMVGIVVTLWSPSGLAQGLQAKPNEPIVVKASGHWETVVFNILYLDEETGQFLVQGEDIFTGTFNGRSHFVASGTLYPDGSASGFSDETVTGVAADGTAGSIQESHQPFYKAPNGDFFEISPITGGTGDWAGSTGLLHYKGFLDPLGGSPNQGGEYQGTWIRPPQK
jgi:hypothetical protein